MQQMTNNEKTASTVQHINVCIAACRSVGLSPAQTLYSMAAWAELHATIEFNGMVADYAPELIDVLDDIKEEYVIRDADVRDPACWIACNAAQRKLLETNGVDLSIFV